MTRKMTLLAMMTAAASVLFAFESLIPMPFPWMRLGLANVVTLLVLTWWGVKEGLAVTVLRVLIGSLLIGRIFQPVFFFSLAGGLTSTLVMAVILKWGAKQFSLVGVSIFGSLVKNVTQLAVAFLIYIREVQIFMLLPLILISSIVTGVLIGVAAVSINRKMATVLRHPHQM